MKSHLSLPLSFALVMSLLSMTFATQSTADTIGACVKNSNGKFRLAESAADCRKREHFISWNTQGPAGPTGPTPQCTAVLEQMPYDSSLVKDETYNGTAQAAQRINSCPAPYMRTGATCLASVTSGPALRQSGSDVINGVLHCRGLIGQAESNILRLISYPICTKVELVCE
jgi:hypothetical protein